jgi:hypothetical protein
MNARDGCTNACWPQHGDVSAGDPSEAGLIEVTVDPEGIGVDDLTAIGVVAELSQQICHVAVDRRTNDGPAEIELRPGNRDLVQGDDCLGLMQRACRFLQGEIMSCG